MRARALISTAATTLVTFALLAPVALADERRDSAEGWWGETNDKVITIAGFILIAFFPLFVLTMSLIQMHLEKRKDEKKKAAKARATREAQLGGW